MSNDGPVAVVAGHICLDIIPAFERRPDNLAELLVPGSLIEVGPAVISTGGAVSNTGLALHRLGIPTRLLGRVGDDLFGEAILQLLRRHAPSLADGMLIARGEPSSYTVVISIPGLDRMFLHCPGVNDTFSAADVPWDELTGIRLFHFGYPPIMRRFYTEGGAELEVLFRTARQRGLTTSLDMAMPDPACASGRVDWHSILARALPHVDVFLPSLEETLYMLDRERFERLSARGELLTQCDGALLSDLSTRLLALGAAVVGLKLGERGLYVRTTEDGQRLRALERAAGRPVPDWRGRELLSPCFEVEVAGTTGCGDSTIAGFLAGLLHGLPPEEVMTAAVGAGACCAERPDAVSGVPAWQRLQARIHDGWRKRPVGAWGTGWQWDPTYRVAFGPRDGRGVGT